VGPQGGCASTDRGRYHLNGANRGSRPGALQADVTAADAFALHQRGDLDARADVAGACRSNGLSHGLSCPRCAARVRRLSAEPGCAWIRCRLCCVFEPDGEVRLPARARNWGFNLVAGWVFPLHVRTLVVSIEGWWRTMASRSPCWLFGFGEGPRRRQSTVSWQEFADPPARPDQLARN